MPYGGTFKSNPNTLVDGQQQGLRLDKSGALVTASATSDSSGSYVVTDRDTNGVAVPTWKPHTYTYDGSGNLLTDTVTDGAATWVRTYTYVNGQQSTDSGWVKQ